MRTIRLAWPPETPPDQEGGEVFLSRDQARHGALVLRLAPGAEVVLTGAAGLAPAKVTTVDFEGRGSKKTPRLGVVLTGPWTGREPETAGPRLALALIQGPRFDWAAEKAAELGAALLIPLITERIKAADGRPGPAKQERWQRLAEEARKQCGRVGPMKVGPVATIPELSALPGPGLFLSPGGPSRTPRFSAGTSPLLVIGPEGGLTPAEEEVLASAGFQPWSLGSTILRSETAALTALARLTTPA